MRPLQKTSVARRSSRGFTLLEILLALAIIALIGGALVGGSARMLSEQPVTANDIFWKAVLETRKTALKLEHEVRLKFDDEKKRFLVVDGIAPMETAPDGFTKQEAILKEFTLPPVAAEDLSVDFLLPNKGGPTIMVAGVLLESKTVKYVSFYADGTCSPFRVRFARPGGASTFGVDPWTCAPVLEEEDSNNPLAR